MRTRRSTGRVERFFLGLALLVPVVLAALLLTQMPFTGLASASTTLNTDDGARIMGQRPAASNPAPPPTLAVPTATPRPTATPVPPTPDPAASPTPRAAGTYTVAPGDELKTIAATYNLSMARLIAANTVPDPDSLQVGQVLNIPGQ